MIKNIMLGAVAVLGIALFIGCTKSKSSSSNYSMTATITQAGTVTAFSTTGATNVYAVDSSDSVSSTTKNLVISGNMFTGNNVLVSSIFLDVANYKGAGTYPIIGTPENDGYYTYSNSYTPTVATYTGIDSGTVSISVSGETVTGTFSCTLTDGSTITNGKFVAAGQNL